MRSRRPVTSPGHVARPRHSAASYQGRHGRQRHGQGTRRRLPGPVTVHPISSLRIGPSLRIDSSSRIAADGCVVVPVDSLTPPVDSFTPPVDSFTPPVDSFTPPVDSFNRRGIDRPSIQSIHSRGLVAPVDHQSHRRSIQSHRRGPNRHAAPDRRTAFRTAGSGCATTRPACRKRVRRNRKRR